MTPRDEHLLLMALPFASRTDASAPAPAPPGAGAPLCSHIFCSKPATDGDLCAQHADLMRDLREEYYEYQREFEGGW